MVKTHYLRGIFYCLIATLSWGSMFPIMTHALTKVDPFTFTGIRYTAVAFIFVFIACISEGKSVFKLDGNLLLLWFFSSVGFAGFGFFVFLGQQQAGPESALTASIIMATMPLLGVLINWILKRSKPPVYSFLFILLSFCGVLLVISKGDLNVILQSATYIKADLLMLIGAFCWILYTIGATYFSHWSPLKYTTLSTLFSLPTIYFCTLLYIYYLPNTPVINIMSFLPELTYMVLIAGALAVLAWNAGNKLITNLNGVLFMNLVPITAFALSTLDGIRPSVIQILGVMLTATALILNNFKQRQSLLFLSSAGK